MSDKHWSRTEYLHQTVTNPNIHIKGTHSYYSDCWDKGFERSVVRYLLGDEVSRNWEPLGELDQLFIGNFVCLGAECVILMGGNSTHRLDWLSLYPFMESIKEAYQPRGDTVLQDGCWLGMRAMIMPGVTIGEGAVVDQRLPGREADAVRDLVEGTHLAPSSPCSPLSPERFDMTTPIALASGSVGLNSMISLPAWWIGM